MSAASSTKRKRDEVHERREGNEYEEVALEGGGFKRRRVGAKRWQYRCEHGKEKSRCKECGGKDNLTIRRKI
jgi:hypothetical protein